MNTFHELPVTQQASLAPKGLSRLKRRVLILGSGQLARDLYNVLHAKRAGFSEVVGFLDHEPDQVGRGLFSSRIIGTYEQLAEVVEKYQVHMVAVCLEDRRVRLPVQSLLEIKAMGLNVVDGHHLYEEESGRLSIDLLRPSALIFSAGFRRRSATMFIKRSVDVLLAVTGIIVLLPVLVFVALAIKLDSHGPVFYRQVRVGLRGQPYMILKFRSMANDAERAGPRWAEANDPRVSRIGWWLRKTRLDEIPQLINVLKGEMSLVGPRPERPVFVQELRTRIPYYDIRHTVKPGLTGWAQTQFRYGASAEDAHMKLQYDLFYVKNMSLLLDFRIIITTVRVVLLGEGAR